jgi:uncharacterized protein
MAEHVILIAGPMGAGKTTAIQSLSEIPVVSTEAANTDRATANKATTTVALDYGEITLDGVEKVRLYGVPGQRRFDYMWRILEERALGLILLINNDGQDPVGDMLELIKDFSALQERGGVVIGVTRSDVQEYPHTSQYVDSIREVYPHITAPVFSVDARNRDHMLITLTALLFNIQAQSEAPMEDVA